MALSDIGVPGAGTLFTYGLEDLIEDDWDNLVSGRETFRHALCRPGERAMGVMHSRSDSALLACSLVSQNL